MEKFRIAKDVYAVDCQVDHTTIAVSRELYEQIKSHPAIIQEAAKVDLPAFGSLTIYVGEEDGSITKVEA